jgi:hypothetical protein
MSLYQVSQRSAEIFGRSSPYYIPQGFYHDLVVRAASPNIHRLAAFSQISNYRLCDWLTVFGFRLDDIPRLQLLTPWRQTVLLDSSVYDDEQWVPWFSQRLPQYPTTATVPIAQVAKASVRKRAWELLSLNKRRFLYAKLGQQDPFAFPTLIPGSIVRIDTRPTTAWMSSPAPTNSKSVFLVDNGLHLHCGYLRRIERERILLCSTHFPFTSVELKLSRRVRILGRVDAEIRSLSALAERTTHPVTTLLPAASATLTAGIPAGVHQLLRLSRMRVGLSFREASAMSLGIARTLADSMYFAAAGTLSDYEQLASPLHHVQKIISLCALYCIDFWVLLRAGGLPTDSLGADAMSDRIVARPDLRHDLPAAETISTSQLGGDTGAFLSNIVGQWEELPLFIKDALPEISGLKDLSLSDIFCVGANQNPTHPSLAGAVLLAVNRRVKAPAPSTATTAWRQPLYVLLRRDGTYICGPCELEDGVLVVYPHGELPQSSMRLRKGIDAEVIGQITTILRSLP